MLAFLRLCLHGSQDSMTERAQPIRFELRRQSDGLVYLFEASTGADGRVGFKRRDGDHWIIWHEALGWIAGTWDSEEVLGRPWDHRTTQSKVMPPEGVWVSRKGAKSYVYDLVYL